MYMTVKNRTSIYNLQFELIFNTKNLKELFNTKNKRECIKNILLEIGSNNAITFYDLKIHNSYVYMLISFKPKVAPTTIVKTLKGTSAKKYFQKMQDVTDTHIWSSNFYMATIGLSSPNLTKEYIQTGSIK